MEVASPSPTGLRVDQPNRGGKAAAATAGLTLFIELFLVLLLFFLYLLKWLTRVDAATLARLITYFAVAVLLVVILLLFLVGRGALAFMAVGLGYPLWRRWRSQRAFRATNGSSSRASTVESQFLAMTLDHDSGTIDGSVKAGAFAGRRLGDLSLADLLALLRELRPTDSDGVALLEAYLDRAKPGWRESSEEQARQAAGSSHGAMGREEALAVLGLAAGASEAQIREAHHRLMLKVHPDHGGSDYLAARLNEARDVLLGG